ncbi:MAG: GyrI-like domain-containing protein [bacterium]
MKIIIVFVVIIIFVAGIFLFFMAKGPDISQFEHLKEPKISTMKDQKMIVVEVKGNPNVVGKDAFPTLYKTFYKLKTKVKRSRPPAPRARWPKPLDTPKNEWTGIYGLPISETVNSLPAKKEAEPEVKIDYWEYGEVAEILHIGPYSKETPTIEKLHQFIKDNGYRTVGDHEEEYIKGPGMFLKGNPEKYITIIRYRVKKQEDS